MRGVRSLRMASERVLRMALRTPEWVGTHVVVWEGAQKGLPVGSPLTGLTIMV